MNANRKDNAALTFMNSGNYEKNFMTEKRKPLTEQDRHINPRMNTCYWKPIQMTLSSCTATCLTDLHPIIVTGVDAIFT